LDLHVLFAAPDPQEGTTLPTATVSLSLDDEVQYRCAGYIQAEIERYAESLGFGATDDKDDDDEGERESGAEESSDGGQGDETKKAKLGKGKKALKEGSSLTLIFKEWDESLIII
jgi:cohesin complex subunit SA-1/2